MKRSTDELAELLAPIAGPLERMRAILAAQIAEESGAVRDMTQHVARFHGKQLRGALVLLTGEATGNATDEHAAVAAIVEMIHLATLVHDDILDGAQVRRRVACVNQRWDNQVAVLLGDFLYARAFALSTDLSSRLASRLLAETTRRLCVGEIEQSARRYDFEMSTTTYEGIARAKTAFPTWREVPPTARARLLRDVAGLVEANAEELARIESENVGKPISGAHAEVAMVADVSRCWRLGDRPGVMDGGSVRVRVDVEAR